MRHAASARLLVVVAVAMARTVASAAEPVDVGSPQLRLSTTLAWPPAAAAAGATFTERMQQPASALQAQAAARERDLLVAMQQAASQQRSIGDLEAQVAHAQAGRDGNPLVVALAVALAALTAGSAFFWWRLRRLAPRGEAG